VRAANAPVTALALIEIADVVCVRSNALPLPASRFLVANVAVGGLTKLATPNVAPAAGRKPLSSTALNEPPRIGGGDRVVELEDAQRRTGARAAHTDGHRAGRVLREVTDGDDRSGRGHDSPFVRHVLQLNGFAPRYPRGSCRCWCNRGDKTALAVHENAAAQRVGIAANNVGR